MTFGVLDCTMHMSLGLVKACPNGDVCYSSLTLLPLRSLTYNKEGSVSFMSSCFSSLFTWNCLLCHY